MSSDFQKAKQTRTLSVAFAIIAGWVIVAIIVVQYFPYLETTIGIQNPLYRTSFTLLLSGGVSIGLFKNIWNISTCIVETCLSPYPSDILTPIQRPRSRVDSRYPALRLYDLEGSPARKTIDSILKFAWSGASDLGRSRFWPPFRSVEQPFAWTFLTGVSGSGKTRVAEEAGRDLARRDRLGDSSPRKKTRRQRFSDTILISCAWMRENLVFLTRRRHGSVWDTGKLIDVKPESLKTWKPRRPTFLLIDDPPYGYASQIVRTLSEKARAGDFSVPVRLLIVDQTISGDLKLEWSDDRAVRSALETDRTSFAGSLDVHDQVPFLNDTATMWEYVRNAGQDDVTIIDLLRTADRRLLCRLTGGNPLIFEVLLLQLRQGRKLSEFANRDALLDQYAKSVLDRIRTVESIGKDKFEPAVSAFAVATLAANPPYGRIREALVSNVPTRDTWADCFPYAPQSGNLRGYRASSAPVADDPGPPVPAFAPDTLADAVLVRIVEGESGSASAADARARVLVAAGWSSSPTGMMRTSIRWASQVGAIGRALQGAPPRDAMPDWPLYTSSAFDAALRGGSVARATEAIAMADAKDLADIHSVVMRALQAAGTPLSWALSWANAFAARQADVLMNGRPSSQAVKALIQLLAACCQIGIGDPETPRFRDEAERLATRLRDAWRRSGRAWGDAGLIETLADSLVRPLASVAAWQALERLTESALNGDAPAVGLSWLPILRAQLDGLPLSVEEARRVLERVDRLATSDEAQEQGGRCHVVRAIALARVASSCAQAGMHEPSAEVEAMMLAEALQPSDRDLVTAILAAVDVTRALRSGPDNGARQAASMGGSVETGLILPDNHAMIAQLLKCWCDVTAAYTNLEEGAGAERAETLALAHVVPLSADPGLRADPAVMRWVATCWANVTYAYSNRLQGAGAERAEALALAHVVPLSADPGLRADPAVMRWVATCWANVTKAHADQLQGAGAERAEALALAHVVPLSADPGLRADPAVMRWVAECWTSVTYAYSNRLQGAGAERAEALALAHVVPLNADPGLRADPAVMRCVATCWANVTKAHADQLQGAGAERAETLALAHVVPLSADPGLWADPAVMRWVATCWANVTKAHADQLQGAGAERAETLALAHVVPLSADPGLWADPAVMRWVATCWANVTKAHADQLQGAGAERAEALALAHVVPLSADPGLRADPAVMRWVAECWTGVTYAYSNRLQGAGAERAETLALAHVVPLSADPGLRADPAVMRCVATCWANVTKAHADQLQGAGAERAEALALAHVVPLSAHPDLRADPAMMRWVAECWTGVTYAYSNRLQGAGAERAETLALAHVVPLSADPGLRADPAVMRCVATCWQNVTFAYSKTPNGVDANRAERIALDHIEEFFMEGGTAMDPSIAQPCAICWANVAVAYDKKPLNVGAWAAQQARHRHDRWRDRT